MEMKIDLNKKIAIATIETVAGSMTIYYNGPGSPLTGEKGDLIEDVDYTPDNLNDAIDAVYAMYGSWSGWGLEWIDEDD